MRRIKTGLTVMSVLLALAVTASANGPEVIDTGACLVPVQKSRVQLVEEDVTVTPPRSDQLGGQVECKYVLRNPDPRPIRLTMAFVVGREGRLEPVTGLQDSDFKVLQAGAKRFVELPVRMGSIKPTAWAAYLAGDVSELPCWDVAIPADGETVLRISYTVWWDYQDPAADDSPTVLVYHAKAAQLWAGPIGHATFRFDLDHAAGRFWRCVFDSSGWALGRVSPGGYTEEEFGVSWSYTDWTPDTDFTVVLAKDCGSIGRAELRPH